MAGIKKTDVLILFTCCVVLCGASNFEPCVTKFENDVITKSIFDEVLDTSSPDFCQHLNQLIVYGLNELDPNILSHALPAVRRLYQGHLARLLEKYGASCPLTVDSIAKDLEAGRVGCDKCAKDLHKIGKILNKSPKFCPALNRLMACLFHEVDFDKMHMYTHDLGQLTKDGMMAETEHLEKLFEVKLCSIRTWDTNQMKHGGSGYADNGSTRHQAVHLAWISTALVLLGR